MQQQKKIILCAIFIIYTARDSFERALYAQRNLNLDRASSLARKKNNE